jgi:hypothetical protein
MPTDFHIPRQSLKEVEKDEHCEQRDVLNFGSLSKCVYALFKVSMCLCPL